MASLKIRLKVGNHEFEAEGDRESVESQVAAWRDLVSDIIDVEAYSPRYASDRDTAKDRSADATASGVAFDKIFSHAGRMVSLSVLPTGSNREADAALLIMLGQRHYVREDLVGGTWILRGLAKSGLRPGRVDRLFPEEQDHIVRVGQNRGVKYRLTPSGLSAATDLALQIQRSVA